MSATVKLLAGNLEADGNLKPGSMSRAIDDELATLLPPVPNEDPVFRRKLALAIARGVIRHLDEREGALTVDVPNVPGPKVQATVHVDTV